MPFDPDQYLAEKTSGAGGFNPDKYLQEKTGNAPADQPLIGDQGRTFIGNMAQGMSAGLALPGASAVQTLSDVLHGRVGLGEATQDYRDIRDDLKSRSEQDSANYPKTALAGQLTGGLIPALASGGSTAEAAALSDADKAWNATKIGAGYGAVSGAANSNADLTKGEVGQTLNDAVKGGLVGGATGALLHGTIGSLSDLAGNTIGKTKVGQAFSEGAEGTNLFNKEAVNGVMKEAVKDTALTPRANFETASDNYTKIINDLENHPGMSVDMKTEMLEYARQADKMQKYSKPGEALYETGSKIKNMILNRLYGQERPVEFQEYTPGSTEQVAAKPTSFSKLQAKLALEQDKLSDQGIDAQTSIDEHPVTLEDGTQYHKGRLAYDEQVQAQERAAKVPEEEIADGDGAGEAVEAPAQPSTKVKGSWTENTPKNLAKAQAMEVKLRSRAAIEGTDPDRFQIIHDTKDGVIHVVEKIGDHTLPIEAPLDAIEPAGLSEAQPGEMTMEQPGSDDYSNVEDKAGNYKSAIKNFYEKFDPGQEAGQVDLPAKAGAVKPVLDDQGNPLTAREGGQSDYTAAQLVGLKKALEEELGGTQGTGGRNIIEQMLGSINSKLELPGVAPEYRAADKAYTNLSQMYNILGLTDESFIKNPQTRQIELMPNTFSKIMNPIRQTESTESTAYLTAQEKMSMAMDRLKAVDPKSAARLEPKVNQAAKNFDLSRDIGMEGFLNKGVLGIAKGAGTTVSHAAGLGVNALKNMSTWSGAQYKAAANSVAKYGEVGQRLSNILTDAADRDSVGRNALLFTIMQTHPYKELLNKHLGNDQ